MTEQRFGTLVDALVAVSIIASATVLLALHDLSEPTAIALYGVAVTLIGGSAKALLALHIPAPARPAATTAPPPPPAPATAP